LQLKASFEGFQLVLIGDLHELPLLHLHTRPFKATVQDWSGDVSRPLRSGRHVCSHAEELFLLARRPQMKFITALKPSIKYYNLTNSAWEPLLEPYSFMLRVSCRRRASSRPFRSHADLQSALGFLSGLSFREWRRCG
jgi:vacuolar protein sorting-associated protein 13A/C